MDERLGEILDRLRDLDHRLARLEHRDAPPGQRPGWHGGPPPGWHGGPPPGWHGGPPPGWHGGRPRAHDECTGHPYRGGHGCGDHPRHHHDDHHDHAGHDFDEKRIIDTIVRLTCENLAPIVAGIVSHELDRRAPAPVPEPVAGPPAP